ncbi:hypothetical protein K3495_g12307 [Podosphaera aphanis]|nr:hypothetical protein K3495_g12307 [Podosphaera aphanis]
MKGANTLNIIQYNVNKSKDRVQNHFLQALDPLEHHVIAIQEPWRNLSENTTIKHPAYHLIFPDGNKGRTCIYVSKVLAIGKWKKETATEEAGGDITSISVQTHAGKVWIHNIYNPPPLSHSSQEQGTLRRIPQILAQEGKHVLIGDFNLHHPRWGRKTVLSHHKLAETLIDIVSERNMELILPKGTITWKSRGSQSTLDLIFVSKPLEEMVVKCQTSTELEASSDHIPVQTELLIEILRKAEEEPRPQWKKAKWDIVVTSSTLGRGLVPERDLIEA